MGDEERKEDFGKILNHLDERDGRDFSLVLKEEAPEIGLSPGTMGFRLDRMRLYETYPWEIQKEERGVWKAQKNLDWEEEDHWKKLRMVGKEEKLESIKEAVEEINYEASVEEDHVLVKVITNKYKVLSSGEVEILDDSKENYAREIRKAIKDLNL